MHWTPRTGEIGTSVGLRTCRQLAHGQWAGDRVGRSAREAGASLHGRSSPGQRAESGTRVAAKRVAMVLDVGARLGVFAQVATGMDSKPPTTLRGGSACRAMLANNRPPLLPGRGALNLGVYLAGMHHLATVLMATCGWRWLPRRRLRACTERTPSPASGFRVSDFIKLDACGCHASCVELTGGPPVAAQVFDRSKVLPAPRGFTKLPPKVPHYSPLVGWSVVFGRTQGRQRLVGRSGFGKISAALVFFPVAQSPRGEGADPRRHGASRAELYHMLGSLWLRRRQESVGRSRTPRTPGELGLVGWSAFLRTVRDFGWQLSKTNSFLVL
eukprot:scaffold6511_cov59-Phaeocystis_antarctica.AAC.2